MKIHRALFAALGGVALAVLFALPASADPKRGEILELDCDVLGTVEVVVFSNATATPGLDITSNRVLIPYEVHITGSFTPTGGEPETIQEDVVRRAPRNGRLDSCTFHEEGTDEFGSFEIDGSALVSYTPGR